ncbi:ParA family protein [Terribacillus sp. 7520-G]|uniref:ParA family protein n=1 Tax=Terribacillus TaxID=459532 RepID=UPI000BA5FD63|nr:ParA family protein [Terribacillus sp. 7520-G]PAD38588.1 hypothetical protein CHH53_10165 [Terribacillus sp. 7520-G]
MSKSINISIINMKGGVGKTTLTINIANELSKKGKKVLVVDMDPQFNATQSLLLYKTRLSRSLNVNKNNEDEIEIKEEITSSQQYERLSKNRETVLQIFGETDVNKPLQNKSLKTKITDKLFLIPGDLKLTREVSGDTSSKAGALLKHLRDNDLEEEFDYILIDCPPTWSILTHSSLVASDFYLIPSKVDFYSSIGIELLEDTIKEKLTNDVLYSSLPNQVKRLGIVFTLVQRKIRAEEERILKLKKQFPDINFFNSDLPYMPSIPSKFVMIEEANDNQTYVQITNSIDRITSELIGKVEKEVK